VLAAGGGGGQLRHGHQWMWIQQRPLWRPQRSRQIAPRELPEDHGGHQGPPAYRSTCQPPREIRFVSGCWFAVVPCAWLACGMPLSCPPVPALGMLFHSLCSRPTTKLRCKACWTTSSLPGPGSRSLTLGDAPPVARSVGNPFLCIFRGTCSGLRADAGPGWHVRPSGGQEVKPVCLSMRRAALPSAAAGSKKAKKAAAVDP
jgi:hypothetical protein